jgi:undecaprenyl-diphosphatase
MDYQLFHAINHLAGHYDGIDDTFEAIAQYAPFALIILLGGLWFWPGPRIERDARQWSCVAAALAATLALGINQVIIQLWERPRPFATHDVVMLLTPSADPSFPSDHATFGFAVAVAILLAHRRVGLIALGIATVLGLSRIYVGEHYGGDVFAGAIIGATAAVAVDHLHSLVAPLIEPPMRLARRIRLG